MTIQTHIDNILAKRPSDADPLLYFAKNCAPVINHLFNTYNGDHFIFGTLCTADLSTALHSISADSAPVTTRTGFLQILRLFGTLNPACEAIILIQEVRFARTLLGSVDQPSEAMSLEYIKQNFDVQTGILVTVETRTAFHKTIFERREIDDSASYYVSNDDAHILLSSALPGFALPSSEVEDTLLYQKQSQGSLTDIITSLNSGDGVEDMIQALEQRLNSGSTKSPTVH